MIKSKKIMYIGYYKELSDWGKYAINNILAIDSAGFDIACRSITFSNNETPDSIKHIEKNCIEDSDICIQHVFPNHLLASKKFSKNIAILANEFIKINHSTWIEKLNEMDQIWVPSNGAKNLLKDTVIYNKTYAVPFAFDTTLYTKQQNRVNAGVESNGKFKFYTIGESNNDGLDRVIRCFHSEFDHEDNAILVVQTNGNASNINEKITQVKNNLGLNRQASLYKKDIVVTAPDLYQSFGALHSFCDCYISNLNQRTLYSEEFNAMAFGNTPIVSKLSDSIDYFGDEHAVDSIYCTNTSPSQMWAGVNNGKDYKILPCDLQIKSMMRKLYEEWKQNPIKYKAAKKQKALERSNMFSIESVGNKLKELLNA